MKALDFFDVAYEELPLDTKEIYLLMGYDNHLPDSRVTELVNRILDEISRLVAPRCGYILRQGKVEGKESLCIGNIQFNPGRIITLAMKGASFYAFFTATIGRQFDEYCKRLKESDDILSSFIADTIGSVLAEATVLWLMYKLTEIAEIEGMKISNNYSPGYCDWALVEQKKLFELFPKDITGVYLTDSSLMLPIKSVSGIVAVGPEIKKRAYSCNICKMTTCVRNRKLRNI